MEEADGRTATSSLKTCAASDLPEACTANEEANSRRHTTSTLTPDTSVEPTSANDSFELQPTSHAPEQTAEVPSIPVNVPRSRRRGLFAQTTILAEIEDPYQYSYKTKWFIVVVVAYAAAAAPMGSAILFPSLSQVAAELHTTPTMVNLTVALYMLSMAIFPLWWSSLSEVFGRRSIYLISFVLFIVFAILSAVSTSIAMLTLMRILCGGAAASVQAVGAGTIADIWKPIERGRAMGYFYLGPLCGPLFAPIIGGALAQRWRWRATMWFIAIYGGTTFMVILLSLPETLRKKKSDVASAEEPSCDPSPGDSPHSAGSRASTREVVHRHTLKCMRLLVIFFVDPLKVIVYLRFPAVFLTVYYASITFGSLYVLNISIQSTFEKPPYSFPTLLVGLLYLPASIGYVIASLRGGKWMDSIMAREARKAGRYDEDGRLIYHPEDRMRENAWLGAIFYPLALIVYGWTVEKGVHWTVPVSIQGEMQGAKTDSTTYSQMIALFFFGLGSMILFSLATTMLTEFMPGKSSSGVALNNLMRNIFSAVGGIVAAPLIFAVGNGWLFTILGILTLASASVVWSMKHFGPQWRITMDKNLQ